VLAAPQSLTAQAFLALANELIKSCALSTALV